jgi:hypothetical protein
MEERELDCSHGPPLVGWRLFRVRRAADGPVLAAPLIHDPDFEAYPSRVIVARCYEHDHCAPAPSCRCGLYAAIEGTLDSLAGYLLDSAHDHDPAIYAEVACSGRLFVDKRGVRAERIEVLRLAASPSSWPGPGVYSEAVEALAGRYGLAVCGVDIVPEWVLSNVMAQGAPTADSTLDLDALVVSMGLRRPSSP